MDEYLILEIAAKKGEGHGFHYDDCKYDFLGASIYIEGGLIYLKKPLFATDTIFYAFNSSFLIVARQWKTALKLCIAYGIRVKINIDYIYDYLQFQCPFTPETLCRGILYLRHGESVTISPNGTVQSRFKRLRDNIVTDLTEPPHIERILKTQLTQVLVNEGIFHLSSGLDSSILVILAAKENQGAAIRVATCETKGHGISIELDAIRKLSAQFGCELNIFDFTSFDIWNVGDEIINRALGYPIAHPSHLVRFLMDTEISRLGKTIITGRGPDESLCGYRWHFPEFSDRSCHFARLQATPTILLQRLIVSDKELGRASKDYFRFYDSIALTLLDRQEYDLWTIFEAWNIIDSSFALGLDVQYVNPFLERHLISTCLSMPDNFKIRGNIQKWLLYHTFYDDYPEYIRNNPKMGLTIDLQPYFSNFSEKELMTRIYDESRFGRKYLNRYICKEMIHSTLDGSRNYGWQIWGLYLCDRAYEVMMQKIEM